MVDTWIEDEVLEMKTAKGQTLSVALVPERDLDEFSSHNNIVAAIFYGKNIPASPLQDYLKVFVSLPQAGVEPLVEVWTSDLPQEVNQFKRIYYTVNSSMIFGSISFYETKTNGLEKYVFHAYQEILNFLERMQFPFLVRCWNYFPNINRKTNGIERYKLFCAGRYNAFFEKYKLVDYHLPAASAVGLQDGPLTIYFIATTQSYKGQHIENPRQVSAYQYPLNYGKHSPSFARATHVDWGAVKHLYVAGTASIIGHKSCHMDNPSLQLREIKENLHSLLTHAKFVLNGDAKKFTMEDPCIIKTYIRSLGLLPLVDYLTAPHQQGLVLVGDICRKELLLETEGIWAGK
jgi:chorismate lyase / 3-hydroxybenzoate synthase